MAYFRRAFFQSGSETNRCHSKAGSETHGATRRNSDHAVIIANCVMNRENAESDMPKVSSQ
jgi:hypothetical protein